MIRSRHIFLPVLFLGISMSLIVGATARNVAPVFPVSKDGQGAQRVFVLDGSPVQDVGNLWVHAPNWGLIGSMPTANYPFSNAPSAQWPGGTAIEYLFVAGLWVGGIVNGVPSVSTAAYQWEFRPSSDPRDIVYESAFGNAGGNRVPSANADDDMDGMTNEDAQDGYDNDADGQIDEDFAAISDQMLSRIFRDDDPAQIYPDHRPLHLAVREESYQFSHFDYDDFVGFTFWITNDGDQTIENAYVSMFADGDVGNRNSPNYWNDDAAAYQADIPVDLGAQGVQTYDFAYWYDVDGDAGQAPGYCGIVILDHSTDPTGATAPVSVGAVTYASFAGNATYEDGGDPTNDFERYELLSSQTIEGNSTVPSDLRTVIAVGPFAAIEPGETISFSCALVVTPRDDFTNVQRAAQAYNGLWFDLDNNPNTGVYGKEHQEHWYLPNNNPVPVAITSFQPYVENGAVRLAWETWTDAGLTGFELLRAIGSGDLRALSDRMLPGNQHDFIDRSVIPGTRYEYQLVAHSSDGFAASSPRVSAVVPAAGLALRQNVPNPFAAQTTVSYTLPERGNVEVSVYDVAGRRVATIFSGERSAGDHAVEWNGVGDNGERVGAGIYFCRIEAGTRSVTRKMLVVR